MSIHIPAPVTYYPSPLHHAVISTAHTHGPLVLTLTLSGMELVNVTAVMILLEVGSLCNYRVFMKHHANVSDEKDESRLYTCEQQ